MSMMVGRREKAENLAKLEIRKSYERRVKVFAKKSNK